MKFLWPFFHRVWVVKVQQVSCCAWDCVKLLYGFYKHHIILGAMNGAWHNFSFEFHDVFASSLLTALRQSARLRSGISITPTTFAAIFLLNTNPMQYILLIGFCVSIRHTYLIWNLDPLKSCMHRLLGNMTSKSGQDMYLVTRLWFAGEFAKYNMILSQHRISVCPILICVGSWLWDQEHEFLKVQSRYILDKFGLTFMW